jgi:acyl dehydratase
MTTAGRWFEEFEAGQRFETGSRTITEADVFAFAELSGDRNPLHLDEAYARTTVFGERVAHGALGLSVATGLVNQLGLTRGTLVALAGITWDFVKPIRFGATVRVRVRVESVRGTSKPDRGLLILAVELVDGAGDVVQRGAFRMLVRRRPAEQGGP